MQVVDEGTGDGLSWAGRLRRVRNAAADHGVDALLVGAGSDLRYLTGVGASSIERFACLALPSAGREFEAVLFVPAVDAGAYRGMDETALGVRLESWVDGHDVYQLIARHLAGTSRIVAVDDAMPARHVLGLGGAMSGTRQVLAGPIVSEIRARKDDAEIIYLRSAAAAVDQVHARMSEFLRPGRSEREAATLIAAAMLEEGHSAASFVIVGSGPHGADPHHVVSDRVMQPGDAVVVDLAGPADGGYFSDSTRTYALGQPSSIVVEAYARLQAAQADAVGAVRPGITAAELDAVARDQLARVGLGGNNFIHRTGHGIGLDVHEDPYIVAGNDKPLQPGMTFSIEPGIYFPGSWGARIEDIVVVTDHGGEALNRRPRDLQIL